MVLTDGDKGVLVHVGGREFKAGVHHFVGSGMGSELKSMLISDIERRLGLLVDTWLRPTKRLEEEPRLV